ncbi:MAG: hydrogenase maturation protease [Stellaceae bacterium]|jgi:hydrogenase maturation protease
MTGILIAGVGNIFQGDDGFGVEVAQRLVDRRLGPGVEVTDFGIRGIDLTYALMDAYDAVVLVDAAARGERPGTLSLIEPDAPESSSLAPGDVLISAHDLDPAKVLRIAAALGGNCRRVLLLACEPLDCGGADGHIGLSAPVAAAIAPALAMIETLIKDLQREGAMAA